MQISFQNRALIGAGVLICSVATVAGIYFYRRHSSNPATEPGAIPSLLAQMPADAPAIGFIDVAALRRAPDSPLSAILGLANTDPQNRDREYADFVRETGFDYTRDLDRAAIAFWPQGPGHDRVPSNQEFLVIADGRFDHAKIAAYAQRSGATVRNAVPPVYEIAGDPPVAFKLLSATRMELASGKNVSELINKRNSFQPDIQMIADIQRVAGAPIFALARTNHLPSDFYAGLGSTQQLQQLARSVQSLTLAGQPKGNLLEVTLDGLCDSTKNALEVATLVELSRVGGSLILEDPKNKRQMTPQQGRFLQGLLNEVRVTREDRLIRLQLEVTPEMLMAAVAASGPDAVQQKKP